MPLVFSTISSPDGERDVIVDATQLLESAETIDVATVTASDPTALELSLKQVNSAETTALDGNGNSVTIAARKGFGFHGKTLRKTKQRVVLRVFIKGDSGTAEATEIDWPIEPAL